MKTIIAWVQEGHLRVKFDYDPSMVQSLKDCIHWKKRRWNGRRIKDLKTGEYSENSTGDDSWILDLDQADTIGQLADQMGYEIVTPDMGNAAPPEPRDDDPYRTMFELVPLDLLKKFYTQIQLQCHPDRTGGDDSISKAANSGWAEIQKIRSKP